MPCRVAPPTRQIVVGGVTPRTYIYLSLYCIYRLVLYVHVCFIDFFVCYACMYVCMYDRRGARELKVDARPRRPEIYAAGPWMSLGRAESEALGATSGALGV